MYEHIKVKFYYIHLRLETFIESWSYSPYLALILNQVVLDLQSFILLNIYLFFFTFYETFIEFFPQETPNFSFYMYQAKQGSGASLSVSRIH